MGRRSSDVDQLADTGDLGLERPETEVEVDCPGVVNDVRDGVEDLRYLSIGMKVL